jgi:hypothetical protein
MRKALVTTVLLCASFVAGSLGTALAQAAASAPKSAGSARKSAAPIGRSECVLSVGLCVTVPPTWQRLGDIFDDLGFVIAEPHPGADSATWPQLTVAAIDVPAQKDGSAPSLDSLVEIVLTPDGSFTSAETQQRTRLILNGSSAEIVRVRLQGQANGTESIEAVALIEGDDGLVYSIALRCAPQDFTRLEPVFEKVIQSWRIQPPPAQSATQSATPSQPKQDSNKK